MTSHTVTTRTLFGLGIAGLMTVSLLADPQTKAPVMGHDMPMPAAGAMAQSAKMMTKAQKIANAMQAAPSTISAKATVLDWPAKEGAAPEVLRAGSNGWNCLPDMPDTKGNDPMCLDASWMKWVEAYLAHTAPVITQVGTGYMMAPGGAYGSNTDPYAMKETPDNHWGFHPPHMMILMPDMKALAGISTDPANGGPYVMFAGTPYAHVMAPSTATSMMPAKGR